MQYSFLDRKLDSLYGSEQTLVDLIGYFSLIAIMVACLGLLGLSIFAAERRTKEIGIRKVLGASIPGLLVLLSKEFTVLLLISNAIAWPVAYYLATEWLGSFAYRIDLSPFVFVLAGSIALLVALATVGTQAVKAALANPVQSLRYE
jgi:putative ABC transport system permease protein